MTFTDYMDTKAKLIKKTREVEDKMKERLRMHSIIFIQVMIIQEFLNVKRFHLAKSGNSEFATKHQSYKIIKCLLSKGIKGIFNDIFLCTFLQTHLQTSPPTPKNSYPKFWNTENTSKNIRSNKKL